MQKKEMSHLGKFGNISNAIFGLRGEPVLSAWLAACVEPRFRWNLYLPEIANDQDGHRQGAERHGIANRVNEIQPIEKMLL